MFVVIATVVIAIVVIATVVIVTVVIVTVEIVTVVIVMVLIVTVVIMTVVMVVIVTSLSKKQLDTLTTDATFEGQRFAILTMFLADVSYYPSYLTSEALKPKSWSVADIVTILIES